MPLNSGPHSTDETVGGFPIERSVLYSFSTNMVDFRLAQGHRKIVYILLLRPC